MKSFKFYRVHVKDPAASGESHGYLWAGTMPEMIKILKSAERNGLDHDTIEEIEIAPLKYKILIALQNYATHPDNG